MLCTEPTMGARHVVSSSVSVRPSDDIVVLVANKTDRRRDCADAEQTVSTEEGQTLARQHRIQFFEICAKDGASAVDEVMFSALDVWLRRNPQRDPFPMPARRRRGRQRCAIQ